MGISGDMSFRLAFSVTRFCTFSMGSVAQWYWSTCRFGLEAKIMKCEEHVRGSIDT
ncbi:hypothetical protein HBI56_084310 [Parastagonospora nodorum]|nr:hypothetical protein HBH52_124680 [Parastagonospora nodorum]KAH4224868.1 hypothetical protein HBI06_118350 [Parastagonospora nodorum]KAH4246952.1 hypothetical protein HBI05_038730 [Parastagonospora nodorum]KAH4811832.1 hypothetical protein HBH61_090690 [Parastagonospora nodorum]KAH4986186.1 hypothetical protein HBI76_120770 [Parastagonospora nodorum]